MSEEVKKRDSNYIGLWKKTASNGTEYHSGSMKKEDLLKIIGLMQGTSVSFAVYTNDRKNASNHPDFNIVLSSYTPKGRVVTDPLDDLPF